VIREALVREQPWVVESLCNAYEAAKKIAQSKETPPKSWAAPEGVTTALLRELIGEDAWPYGIGPNAKALVGFVAAARIQGLVYKHLDLKDLFVPNLPDSMR
jgi:4,5-dihydroxyphthalate decarboxylase